MIQPPDEVFRVLRSFNERSDTFEVHDVEHAISASVNRDEVGEDKRHGFWAECAAFGFDVHPVPDGGPWNSYFQPRTTFTDQDGSLILSPDIADADAHTIEYWSGRARTVKHPILAARYADLVWDFGRRAAQTAPSIEFARLAIDSYIAALKMDDGEAWGDNFYNLERVLSLTMSIKDSVRTVAAVEAIIDYADRTAEDHKIGTYCYLFDLLLLGKRSPPLTAEQERLIVARFEQRFAELTKPGGPYDVNPHAPKDIGLRLAEHYNRQDREEDRVRVLVEIAKAFERRAKLGEAGFGIYFLNDARLFYLKAGQRQEAERVLREVHERMPEAKKAMAPIAVEHEVPQIELQEYLDDLVADGMDQALFKWATYNTLHQDWLKEQKEELAKKYVFQAMFPATILGEEGVKANVDDTRGDPDGPMVFETSRWMVLGALWMSSGIDHLIQNGLTSSLWADFINESPLFTKDRLLLIRRGIEAHIVGDYVQSIHVLVPQIERALVYLVYLLGGAPTKQHRSGRGVTQYKNINDALADEATRKTLGPDMTIYLLATLSHPKGHNIRNEACHGLWGPERFTKYVSERVLHAMTALSLLRAKPKPPAAADDGASRPPG